MASYQNIDAVDAIMGMNWYPVRLLSREVSLIRGTNFSIVEQRQQALERLNKIPSECPFDTNVRFPEHGSYVCEGLGDWTRKFQQLRAALMYKDLAKDDKAKDSSSGRSADQNDAQQAFINATTAMLDQLVKKDGIYNRASFESTFKPDWR